MTVCSVFVCKVISFSPPTALFSPFCTLSPFSLPPESSREFPSGEQVIELPPPPSPPLSLPFLLCLGSLALSLCLCKAFQSVPITRPWLTAFPSSVVQWLYERSAVWSQSRLVEEVKAEVSSLSFSSLFSSLFLVLREWQTESRAALRFEILHLRVLDMIVIWFPSLFSFTQLYCHYFSLLLPLCCSVFCLIYMLFFFSTMFDTISYLYLSRAPSTSLLLICSLSWSPPLSVSYKYGTQCCTSVACHSVLPIRFPINVFLNCFAIILQTSYSSVSLNKSKITRISVPCDIARYLKAQRMLEWVHLRNDLSTSYAI